MIKRRNSLGSSSRNLWIISMGLPNGRIFILSRILPIRIILFVRCAMKFIPCRRQSIAAVVGIVNILNPPCTISRVWIE